MSKKNKKKKFTLFSSSIGENIKSTLALIAVAFLLYIFTFFIDGEMGVILIAFMLFAPLVSLFFAVYAHSRVKVSFDCDGYVKKGSKLKVRVTVEKTGRFPLGIIEIKPRLSEAFVPVNKVYRLSLAGKDSYSFEFDAQSACGGNGEIALEEVCSCGFLGFLRVAVKGELPPPVSVGVIPDIPTITASSQLFRSIADVVLTSDDDEDNDTVMLFSANTAPGYEHREYVQGDPLKRVNWKLSSKKDKLMVRLDEAVASVQPVIVLDLYRSSKELPQNAIAAEEKILSSVFGLLSLLVRQGIASTFIYYGPGGGIIAENVDNPEYPEQLLLKVLALKVIPDRHIKLSNYAGTVCACVIASTDCNEDVDVAAKAVKNDENVSLIGVSQDSPNLTDLPMWYLDGDNNFKMV